MYSFRNTVILAIMQIGIIVAGVLAAGLWHRAWLGTPQEMPLPAAMLYNYGIVGFSIPLVWSISTLALIRRPEVPDETKDGMFWLGVLVLMALIVFIGYADLAPVSRIIWNFAGEDAG